MNKGPDIKGNPLVVFVCLIVVSYIFGEFIFPTYPLIYFINLIGIITLIFSVTIFFSSFRLFKSYDENLLPTSTTHRIIKTSIFAYTRNPIYLAFILFLFSMFLIFENVMYFISFLGLSIWLHHWVIKAEEEYLLEKFDEEYRRYKKAVKRWLFF